MVYGIGNIQFLFPWEEVVDDPDPDPDPDPEPTLATIIPRTPRVTQASAQTAGAPFTALRPVDQAAGDLVVAWFGFSDTPTNSTGPGGGWVLVPNSQISAVTGRNGRAYYQFDPSADPVVSQIAAGRITAVLEAYGNVDPDNPLDIESAVTATASATPLAIGSITPVTPGARVISAALVDASTGTWTVPTEQVLVGSQTSGVGRGLAVAHENFETPGATGTRTFAFSVGGVAMAGASFALRPALVFDPDPPTYESLFTTQLPLLTGQVDNTYTLGTVFSVTVAGQIAGIRVYVGEVPTTAPKGVLYLWTSNTVGSELATKDFGTLLPNQWNLVMFDTPVDVNPEETYVVAWGPTNNYNASTNFFESDDLISGHLIAPHDTSGKLNGKFRVTADSLVAFYPDQSFSSGCYFVDVLFLPDEA